MDLWDESYVFLLLSLRFTGRRTIAHGYKKWQQISASALPEGRPGDQLIWCVNLRAQRWRSFSCAHARRLPPSHRDRYTLAFLRHLGTEFRCEPRERASRALLNDYIG